jgi:hypothetical protein
MSDAPAFGTLHLSLPDQSRDFRARIRHLALVITWPISRFYMTGKVGIRGFFTLYSISMSSMPSFMVGVMLLLFKYVGMFCHFSFSSRPGWQLRRREGTVSKLVGPKQHGHASEFYRTKANDTLPKNGDLQKFEWVDTWRRWDKIELSDKVKRLQPHHKWPHEFRWHNLKRFGCRWPISENKSKYINASSVDGRIMAWT